MRRISYTGHVGAALIGAAARGDWLVEGCAPDGWPTLVRKLSGDLEVRIGGDVVGKVREVSYGEQRHA